jgi:hypothetical protein
VLELNETADRNVSLVEDRMLALRKLLDEVDLRIGLGKRELANRVAEREVYEKLSRRRPIVPEASRPFALEAARRDSHAEEPRAASTAPEREAPITLSFGSGSASVAEPDSPERPGPEIVVAEDLVAASKSKREEALELHRRGISAELIAAKVGATVAEIELLVEMDERRSAGAGNLF